MEADEAKPVAVLAAEKCVYNLTCPRRVAVRSERIVRVHRIHSAGQFVDVGLNDFAVVEGDRGVGDDVVVHRLVWFIGLEVNDFSYIMCVFGVYE